MTDETIELRRQLKEALENPRDEWHTMKELYQHRMALNVALFHAWRQIDLNENLWSDRHRYNVGKSKLHHDGTMFEGGYFIVFAQTPAGQISYHYKLEHWDAFKIPEWDQVPFPYDGHTPNDTIERLLKL